MAKSTAHKSATGKTGAKGTPAASKGSAPSKDAVEAAAGTATAKKGSAAKTSSARKGAAAKKPATVRSVAKKVPVKKSSASAGGKAGTKKTAATGTGGAKTSAGAKKKKGVSDKAAGKKTMGRKSAVDVQDAPEDVSDEIVEIPDSNSTVVPYERDRSSHYMNAEQLAHFRRKLIDWKQQLMEEVDRTVGHMKDDATNFPDPNDRATQEEEFSLELRTRDRERKLIKKINEAQKRIDDDEYGYCETCGIEIGLSRLEARPTAELCIDCKTLEEIRERQTA